MVPWRSPCVSVAGRRDAGSEAAELDAGVDDLAGPLVVQAGGPGQAVQGDGDRVGRGCSDVGGRVGLVDDEGLGASAADGSGKATR